MEEKKHKEIELRSEEVQEVMGQMPHWILRWGIAILFMVVMMLVVGSWFFRYPDVITTEMVLTGESPVAQIAAQTSGRITSLYVADGERVVANSVLAVVENPDAATDSLRSPIDGVVAFTTDLSENQYIRSSNMLFTVVPYANEQWIGKAQLPVGRSGKVKIGQRVLVRFLNYPDQEFGVVSGKVAAISLMPLNGAYRVDVAFPSGLTTNYGIDLPVSYGMMATAEIVTEELRLIERFFMPLRRVLKEGLN